MPLAITGPTSGSSSTMRRHRSIERCADASFAFAPTSERPDWGGTPLSLAGRARPSSPGIHFWVPLLRRARGRPLPDAVASALRARLPSRCFPFRPRGFAPPRRFSPGRGSRACCIPVPDMGFVPFRRGIACSTRGWLRSTARFPATCSYPSKISPRR
jgi:hypothetical protein